MTSRIAFSLTWLCAKAILFVVLTMQAAEIIVVAYQQF